MHIFFADDARQATPSRLGMGPLVATGAIQVAGEAVRELERAIDDLCRQTGFPPREEFKWSPNRGQWMRDNLIAEERATFYEGLFGLLERNGVKAVVVIEDVQCATATDCDSAEEDVTRLLLERAHNQLAEARSDGIVIVDRPGGGRPAEDKFLWTCLETVQAGTRYVKPERIAINVVSTPSHLVRLVQAADVVTSCTLAAVAGEPEFAPPVFEMVKRLMPQQLGRIGGVSLKLHPDYKYANLYHWLVGDEYLVKYPVGVPLPAHAYPYTSGPHTP